MNRPPAATVARTGIEFAPDEQLCCRRGHALAKHREPLPPHGIVLCIAEAARNSGQRCDEELYVIVLDNGARVVFWVSHDEAASIRKHRMSVHQAMHFLQVIKLGR